tara:strand:- start:42 stop:842 length:801 start_codon:yes stop_codon:yes gene_type:complete
MSYTQKKPNMHISYGGESVQQHKKNLIDDNPLAKHASALKMQEDHYGSPFHLMDGKKTKKEKATGSGDDYTILPKNTLDKEAGKTKGGSLTVDKNKILPTTKMDTTGVKDSDKFASSTLGKSSDSKSKSTDSKPSAPKYKSGSEGRKAEYDAKGWKYDDTIKGYNRDGSKKATSTPAPVSTTGSETIKAKEVLKTAKSDAKEGQAGRQDTRKAKRISKRANRVSKREDIRKGRQAAKDAGLKGKAKRDAIKTAKAAAKKKQREANK